MRSFFLAALFLANAYIWTLPETHALRVSFFNVGEGDAVFIQSPSGTEVLIDGGPPGGGVLRSLGRALPFFDRSLDAVIETTANTAESGGLIDVLGRYSVGTFIDNGFSGDTKTTSVLQKEIAASHAKRLSVSRGARIQLGFEKGAPYIDVLYPEKNAVGLDANSASLFLRVVYGKTSFLLSSAAPQKTEKRLLALGAPLQSDVLKAGQHGSKAASAPEFATAVSPRFTVFSRGCDNTFHHPAPEVVALFEKLGSTIFDTCTGSAVFVSDGLRVVPERS